MPEQTTSDDPRRQRLEEAIGAFLVAVDAGQKPDPNEWLARHGDLRPELAEFFADLGLIDKLVEPLKLAPEPQPVNPTVSLDSTHRDSNEGPIQIGPPTAQADLGGAEEPNGGEAPAPLAKGTRVRYFGDYELEKVLGEGGMGIVYKARQRSLNRLVAVKMIKTSRFPSADEVRRFQNEAEAVARLDHPNIVPIYEVNQFEDQHYFAMKLIAGESLDKHLKDYMTDPKRAARLVATTAAAIYHAHQRGILHRDLKPANILVDPQGQPHVTDFGLAKRVEGDSELTRSGAIVGTPAYMAPEQASPKKGAVTTATDVYGLGAILYALLAGRAPFSGTTVLDTLEQVRETAPESPRKINARIPRDLEVICLKCLEKEPRRRYASADALAEDLKCWMAGLPIAARPPGNAARAWMWCRRNPVVAGAGGAVAAALLAVVLLSLLYARQQTQLAHAQKLYGDEQNRRAEEQAVATAKFSAQSTELSKQSQNLKSSLADSNRRLAMLFFERAGRALDSGQVSHGLLWLVECWRYADNAADSDWKRVARANLSFWRYYCPEIVGAQAGWIFSHPGDGLGEAYSPDNKTVLRLVGDDYAQMYEVATGESIGKRMSHQGPVVSVAFSPDGKTALTASVDQTARFWDAATGQPIGHPIVSHDAIGVATFSPNGKTVVTIGPRFRFRDPATGTVTPSGRLDRTAQLWDAKTAKRIGLPIVHEAVVDIAIFSPDGNSLLTTDQSKLARLTNVITGMPICPLIVGEGSVTAATFSPDGNTILLGTMDGITRRWDAHTGRPIGEPLNHQYFVASLLYSPDGKTVVVGYRHNAARLWDAETWLPIGSPLEHKSIINSVGFSPDGKTVLTGGNDATARLWDAATALPLGEPFVHETAVIEAKYSPDGKSIWCRVDEGVSAWQWDAASRRPIGRPLQHSASIRSVAFGDDARTVLTGVSDKVALLWDVASGVPIGKPIQREVPSWSSVFSPDGKTVVRVNGERIARLWDVHTGQPIGPPLVDAGFVFSAAYGPDGKTIITAGRKERYGVLAGVRLWFLPAMIDDDLPRIQTWVETITGHEVNRWGDICPLVNSEEWAKRRDRLRRLGGPPKADPLLLCDPILYGPDPTARARAWMERKRWADAESAFAEVIGARPFEVAVWIERGRFYAGRSEPARAAADFVRAFALNARSLCNSGPRGTYQKLLAEIAASEELFSRTVSTLPADSLADRMELLLARGDCLARMGQWDKASDALSTAASLPWRESDLGGILEEHASAFAVLKPWNTADAMDRLLRGAYPPPRSHYITALRMMRGDMAFSANRIARLGVLRADITADHDAMVHLAEIALKELDPEHREIAITTLGAALYRVGRYQDAIAQIEEGMRLRDEESSPWDWAFLAMAHHRLGHHGEANSWLDRLRERQPAADPDEFWGELEIGLLRSEAEAVILHDPVFPADPFAR